MTSAYLAIFFLKQTPLPEKRLRILLSYLPQEPLKENLCNADIYKRRKNMSKHDLIDMVITEKKIKKLYIHKKMMIYQKKKLMKYLKILKHHNQKFKLYINTFT